MHAYLHNRYTYASWYPTKAIKDKYKHWRQLHQENLLSTGLKINFTFLGLLQAYYIAATQASLTFVNG